jgi:protein-tyrosine phosphatase
MLTRVSFSIREEPLILVLLADAIFIVLLGLAVYLAWQASIPPAAYDAMFAVREVEPDEPHTLRLSDGRTLELDGRRLPLEGAENFRDLGGYATAGGQRVAWGRVYRANDLSRLTAADWELIRSLGIQLVCDLRSPPEVRRRPDRPPAGIQYRHLPVFPRDPIRQRHVLFQRHRLEPVVRSMYRDAIIDQGALALGALLRLAADPANLPLVFHCTGGKDRTGIAAALLLHICDVPRATIIADYTLTNRAIEKVLTGIRRQMSGRRPPGLRLEQLYPLFSARAELIETAFAHIESTYGSVDAYLRGPAGLSEAELLAIRKNLLESV